MSTTEVLKTTVEMCATCWSVGEVLMRYVNSLTKTKNQKKKTQNKKQKNKKQKKKNTQKKLKKKKKKKRHKTQDTRHKTKRQKDKKTKRQKVTNGSLFLCGTLEPNASAFGVRSSAHDKSGSKKSCVCACNGVKSTHELTLPLSSRSLCA